MMLVTYTLWTSGVLRLCADWTCQWKVSIHAGTKAHQHQVNGQPAAAAQPASAAWADHHHHHHHLPLAAAAAEAVFAAVPAAAAAAVAAVVGAGRLLAPCSQGTPRSLLLMLWPLQGAQTDPAAQPPAVPPRLSPYPSALPACQPAPCHSARLTGCWHLHPHTRSANTKTHLASMLVPEMLPLLDAPATHFRPASVCSCCLMASWRYFQVMMKEQELSRPDQQHSLASLATSCNTYMGRRGPHLLASRRTHPHGQQGPRCKAPWGC